jgi:hypothetical protein
MIGTRAERGTEVTMHWNLMEWWPTIWMSVLFVLAWGAILWLALKAMTDRRGRGAR